VLFALLGFWFLRCFIFGGYFGSRVIGYLRLFVVGVTQEIESDDDGADEYRNQQQPGKPAANRRTLWLIGVLDCIACLRGLLCRSCWWRNWCGAALGIFVLGWVGLLGGGCSSLGLAGGNGRDHLGTILLILWFRFYRRFRLGWFLRFCRRFRFLGLIIENWKM